MFKIFGGVIVRKNNNIINSVVKCYSNNQNFVNIIFLLTVSVCVFYNSLNNYLLVDDFFNTVGPPNRNIFNIFFKNAYGENIGGHYRPMEALSHMFDNYFYGYNNHFGRHFTNVMLHLLNGIIVYIIAFMMTNNSTTGLIAGLLFSINPIHSQSLPAVAWISGRTDLIVAFFYLFSFMMFLIFSFYKSYLSYFISLISFMLALLSKEMAVTLPIVILLYILINNKNYSKKESISINFEHWTIFLSGFILFITGIMLNFNVLSYFGYEKNVLQSIVFKSRLIKFGIIFSGFSLILTSVILKFSKKASKFYIYVRFSIPYFLILIFYIIVRTLVVKGFGGIYKSADDNVLLNIGIDTFWRDIYSLLGLIWPLGDSYNIDIIFFHIKHALFFHLVIIVVLLILLTIFYKLVIFSKKMAFVFLWIFITLIPVHNIVITSWGFQPRYLYIPSVGYCIFISMVLNIMYMSFKFKDNVLIKNIFITTVVFIYIIMNCFYVIRHNERIVKSGNVMREFVSDIRKSVNNISEMSNIYFITFPVSPIDFSGIVWVTAYMYDILNYADNQIGFKKKYKIKYILFIQGEIPENITIKKINESKYIIENIKYNKCFVIPKEYSNKEKQIEKVYKILPPFPAFQPLPSEGNSLELNGASINMLRKEKHTNMVGLEINIKDDGKIKEDFYYIYDNHGYRLLKMRAMHLSPVPTTH